MRDIRYKWNKGATSVGVSNEVSLPQFKVLGHRQRTVEISLSTGKSIYSLPNFISQQLLNNKIKISQNRSVCKAT